MNGKFNPPIGRFSKLSGKCISLVGDDVDTDRIIPARFLKCIDFNSLGNSVFDDDSSSGEEDDAEDTFQDHIERSRSGDESSDLSESEYL